MKRPIDLARANLQLTQEINERKRAEQSLQGIYAETKRLTDRLLAENSYLQQELAREYNFGEIVGQSRAMSRVRQRVEEVAALPVNVLLHGEAGSGRTVVARAIHDRSPRRERPLITVDLAALPANLVESELFGWERGECTGAESRQIGRLELADAGTIFLEEIAELPLDLQGRVLRLIAEGNLERLGSPRTIKVDVRVIASSSQDLEAEVKSGRFREELWRRLRTFTVTLAPLRQRKEDIPLLVDHFLAKYHRITGRKAVAISRAALDDIMEYDWPGNVRELEGVIEWALITSRWPELPVSIRSAASRSRADAAGEGQIKGLAELERDHIVEVLQKTGWRIEGARGAASLLGLNPSTLRARMRKNGILRQCHPER